MAVITSGGHVFEIVDTIPKHYTIWNIGHWAPPGYIPLCETVNPNSYQVNLNTLKAYKTENAGFILEAVSYSGESVQKMEQFLKNKPNDPHADIVRRALTLVKSLPWTN